jgi:CheY-like chemotaxis protein
VKETPTGFDIVFTDNQMPEMLRIEFARKVRGLQSKDIVNPAMQIVLVSG